jgi:hypothetical protein
MNNNANALKDTRLLEALEFIDDSYVADVFACIKAPDVTAAPASGKAKILRSLKYAAAVAACALLMSTLIPVVQYVSGNLTSFLPSGWFEENKSEYTYPMFVDDLEPLTEEEMKDIRRASYQFSYDYLYAVELSRCKDKYEPKEAEKRAHQYAAENAEEGDYFKGLYVNGSMADYRYYGKIGDCVFLAIGTGFFNKYQLGESEINENGSMYVYCKGTMYHIVEAYEKGLFSEDDVEIIKKRKHAYREFLDQWLEEQRKEYEKNRKE